ncbi:hypothetical protein PR048_026012 [Dryococelus australis]|uniref:Uncharacterized protein n=1 Tax=Dryococelus australis TaxID=614101 RepID=A0ABQ9GK70_9NEOP|nr:hypothetical protein PR048_026012 [Dryococelus australis]
MLEDHVYDNIFWCFRCVISDANFYAMTSLLQLDNLDCTSTSSEQIIKLFPKCRPRDVNLNSVPIQDDNNENTIVMMDDDNDRCARHGDPDEGEHAEEDEGHFCEGNDEDSSNGEEEDLIIDHTSKNSSPESEAEVIVLTGSKGGSYKLRDSRIIEIAGGRELFSQSRSKAVKKSRLIEDMERGKRSKTQGVWELRARCVDAKKQRNSREVTETVFSTEVRSVRHHRASTGDSTTGSSAPAAPLNMAVITGREVVVFDDIGEDWRGLRLDLQGMGVGLALEQNGNRERGSSGSSSPITQSYHRNATDFFKAVTSASDLDGDSLSPEHNNKVARIIGSLPIAEYEGSPRRYGPRQLDASQSHPVLPSAQSLLASPSVYPPAWLSSGAGRVLQVPGQWEVDSGFQELEYELRRQAGAGSAYVGQRLAKLATLQQYSEVEESPRKVGNGGLESDALQDSETHFLDLSADTASTEDLGETEVGLQVGHSRNFTLSPETTDCDSNCGDLDSEVSLLGPPDSTRLYSSMPVLEDGLSSGHASDTDNNPTVLLMKRQITEIEREIVQRSTRHKMTTTSSPDEAGPIKLTQDFLSNKEVVTTSSKGTMSSVEEIFGVGKSRENSYNAADPELEALDPLASAQMTPPPPAPQPHRSMSIDQPHGDAVEAAIKDIRLTLQRTKTLPLKSPSTEEPLEVTDSPIWVPRRRTVANGDSELRKGPGEEGVEEEADTDLETDRLLGQQRTDDHGFFDEKVVSVHNLLVYFFCCFIAIFDIILHHVIKVTYEGGEGSHRFCGWQRPRSVHTCRPTGPPSGREAWISSNTPLSQ